MSGELIYSKGTESRLRLRHALMDLLTTPKVFLLRNSHPNIFGGPVPLHYGFKRWAWRSERGLEIALAKRAMNKFEPQNILEVGNVLFHSGISGHQIVDKYEVGPGVQNIDILEFEKQVAIDFLVSISTLEHVGWDEEPRDSDKARLALSHISDLSPNLLITIPVGHHLIFEDDFINGPFDAVYLAVKIRRSGRWERRPLEERKHIKYGWPYGYGNGVLIGVRGQIS
jgi:hypothetical protein